MFRRQYLELLGIGTGGAIIGQAETAENETTNETEPDPLQNESANATDQDDALIQSNSCETKIQFGDRELVRDDSEFSTNVYAAVTVENLGGIASGEITVGAGWLDADDNFLDQNTTSLPSLDAGGTWNAHIDAIGPDPEDVDDFEVGGGFAVDYPRSPQGMTVTESELEIGDVSASITGVAENTREADLERIEAIGKIYADDGTVIGGGSTVQWDLPAGRNWSFEIRMPDRATEAADHGVLLDAQTFQIQG